MHKRLILSMGILLTMLLFPLDETKAGRAQETITRWCNQPRPEPPSTITECRVVAGLTVSITGAAEIPWLGYLVFKIAEWGCHKIKSSLCEYLTNCLGENNCSYQKFIAWMCDKLPPVMSAYLCRSPNQKQPPSHPTQTYSSAPLNGGESVCRQARRCHETRYEIKLNIFKYIARAVEEDCIQKVTDYASIAKSKTLFGGLKNCLSNKNFDQNKWFDTYNTLYKYNYNYEHCMHVQKECAKFCGGKDQDLGNCASKETCPRVAYCVSLYERRVDAMILLLKNDIAECLYYASNKRKSKFQEFIICVNKLNIKNTNAYERRDAPRSTMSFDERKWCNQAVYAQCR